MGTVDGARWTGSWFVHVTEFARETSWLNGVMVAYTDFGLVVFAGLFVAGWWVARRRDAAQMATILAVPVVAVMALVLNSAIKIGVAELRPCRAFPAAFLLERCPPVADYSFPSNHTVVAAAITVALWVFNWRWGLVAASATAMMAFSRVYVGAHFPHDVAASIVVGIVVGLPITLVFRTWAPRLIDSLPSGCYSVRGLPASGTASGADSRS